MARRDQLQEALLDTGQDVKIGELGIQGQLQEALLDTGQDGDVQISELGVKGVARQRRRHRPQCTQASHFELKRLQVETLSTVGDGGVSQAAAHDFDAIQRLLQGPRWSMPRLSRVDTAVHCAGQCRSALRW